MASQRYRILLMLLCLWHVPITGHTDQKVGMREVAVVDKTEPGSPLQVSGHVSFDESVVDNQVTSSRSENIRARNVSGKRMLLLVAYFEEAGSRSSGEDFELVVDKFFQDETILPGEEVILLQRPMGEHHTSEPFRMSLDDKSPPIAEFLLRFVQFSDGSTFGDPAAATKWINSRKSVLQALRALRQAYRDGGEAAFLQNLQKYPTGGQASSDWNQITQVQQTSGTQAAVTFLDHLLASSLQHQVELEQK
jgi:hypothetical protein